MLAVLGKHPISMLEDDRWDTKSHAYLDPSGANCMNADREVKLSPVQFIEQRLKNIDPAFSQVPSFVFGSLGN